MRVVQATRFGGPEVLVTSERPDPVAGSGQIVVDIELAEVLFLDTQLRAGWGHDFFPMELPFVPGVGVAGVVGSAGAGVDPSWVGRRVIAGMSGSGAYPGGGYAERAAVPVDAAFEVPDGVDLKDAIAALHDGLLGISRIEKARIEPGERVLITAATGSIGAWLVPLAQAGGAQVIAAARGEKKLQLVRKRGADAGVDYSEPGWTDRARAASGGGDMDVVFDGAGDQLGRAAFEITARGGRFFSYGAASGDFPEIGEQELEQREITLIGIHDEITPAEQRRFIELALAEIATGRIRAVIGQVIPLERAAEAHAAIESRSVAGKTLLQVIR